jgi:hypothetical protein
VDVDIALDHFGRIIEHDHLVALALGLYHQQTGRIDCTHPIKLGRLGMGALGAVFRERLARRLTGKV